MASDLRNKIKLASVDDLFSTEESRTISHEERVQQIQISEIKDFPNHPFKVRQDEAMQNMVNSIKTNGVRQPAIIRPHPDGGYEMVSGHRRKEACMLVGLDAIPAVVREMTGDEATICMVESNHQRENILPSEKAFSLKMQLESMKRQAGRPAENNSVQLELNLKGKQSRDILAKRIGESSPQVFRFIRLTKLAPPLLLMVDEKKIAFNPAVELSYLSKDLQTELHGIMEEQQCTPSLSQAQRMKKASQEGKLDTNGIELIMSEEKPQQNTIKIKSSTLEKYFPKEYTPKQKEDMIIKALDLYCRKKEKQSRNYER